MINQCTRHKTQDTRRNKMQDACVMCHEGTPTATPGVDMGLQVMKNK